jgi:RNA polymerase sigma factor (TIGR02999 family)
LVISSAPALGGRFDRKSARANERFSIRGAFGRWSGFLQNNNLGRTLARSCYDVAMSDVTRLLQAISDGDSCATAKLLPIVYEELRRLARAHMANERAGHTLQSTALVHEAYMRLVDNANAQWDGRGHFFAAAAEAMRRILIDYARRKKANKRGGNHQRIEFDDEIAPIAAPCDNVDDLLALNDALERLAVADPAKAELVKLLYFAGLNLEEAAAAQGISRTTAYRHWLFARAWLHDAIAGKT